MGGPTCHLSNSLPIRGEARSQAIYDRLAARLTGLLTAGGGSTFTLIGCSRASTEDMYSNLQRDTLARAGCGCVFEDRRSGAKADRRGPMTSGTNLTLGALGGRLR